MASMLKPCYRSLRMYVSGTSVVLQPDVTTGAQPVETLSADLASGSVELLHKEPLTVTPSSQVLGLIGVMKVYGGAALAVITSAQQVATINGQAIYRMTGSRLLYDKARASSKEARYVLRCLHDAIDPEGSGRNVFFSHGYDLTLSAQRAAEAAQGAGRDKAMCERSDARFLWNGALAAAVVAAGGARFVFPMILGVVAQLPQLAFAHGGAAARGSLTLLARRSMQRLGTRHWRRGADHQGAVANFVETEQLLQLDIQGASPSGPSSSNLEASYVQVRGSIPLLWTQLPNIKYKPPTKIGPKADNGPVFDAHMRDMLGRYGAVVCVNLVNQHGSEGKLEAAFRAEVQSMCEAHPDCGLRYIPFDFHAECGSSRWHRLALLWDTLVPDVLAHGYYLAIDDGNGKAQIKQLQRGGVRTNCVDCLDRTNVVQGVLARKALEGALKQAGLMRQEDSLPTAYPALERQFRCMWADHGDAVSRQYAGTGAMKSGFTRTGKRTLGGLLDDGLKSGVRYYLGNFQDAAKQDAMDLVAGNFVPGSSPLPSVAPQASPLVPILLALASLVFGAHRAGQLVSERRAEASAGAVLQLVVAPLVLGMGLLAMVMRHGRHLVARPRLCPHLADTLSAARPPAAKQKA